MTYVCSYTRCIQLFRLFLGYLFTTSGLYLKKILISFNRLKQARIYTNHCFKNPLDFLITIDKPQINRTLD